MPLQELAMTILTAESTLTTRYQTTIPDAVRKVAGELKVPLHIYGIGSSAFGQLQIRNGHCKKCNHVERKHGDPKGH